MAGQPPHGGEPDPTVALGGVDTSAPSTVTGPQWWRRRPVQIGIAVAALALVVVAVLLTRGEGPVTVPDVVGLPVAEAVAELVAVGLEATTELVDAPEGIEPGSVVAQDPGPDTRVDSDSVVVLQVAQRPADDGPVEVPDVVGLSVDAATAALAVTGLEAQIVRVDAADDVAPGTVVDQDPAAGELIDPGSVVVLEVARAPDDDDDDDRGAVRNVISWILSLGPSAPTGPSAFRAYELLSDQDCTTLLERLDSGDIGLSDDGERLYRGAAAACLAAFRGESGRWADAEAALDAIDPGDPAQVNCFDAAAYALLERLVEAHRANPSGEFVADTTDTAEGTPPCPTITAVEPEQGAPDIEVEIIGTNFDRVVRVELYDDDKELGDLTITDRTADRLRVAMQDVGGASSVCIVLVAEPDWHAAGAPFTIVQVETQQMPNEEQDEPNEEQDEPDEPDEPESTSANVVAAVATAESCPPQPED